MKVSLVFLGHYHNFRTTSQALLWPHARLSAGPGVTEACEHVNKANRLAGWAEQERVKQLNRAPGAGMLAFTVQCNHRNTKAMRGKLVAKTMLNFGHLTAANRLLKACEWASTAHLMRNTYAPASLFVNYIMNLSTY